MEVYLMNCVSIELFKSHPRNEVYYSDLSPEKYEEVKHSIEINGIRDPLKVLPDYTIIAGHQRFKIAKELGLTQVPVTIMDVSQEEAEYLLIADNEERRQSDDDPIKKAKRAKYLKEYWGVKNGGDRKSEGQNVPLKNIGDIAEAINEDERTTKRLLKLNDLIPELQSLVSSGKLGKTSAEQLAYLDQETQTMLLETLGEELSKKTLAETKEIRQELEKLQKESEEKKEAEGILELSRQIEDAEKTIEEYEEQICGLEGQIKKLKNKPSVPEDYEKIKTEIKARQEEIKQLKLDIEQNNEAYRELEKELNEKKDILRTFTKAQLESKNKQKVKTTLSCLVQDLGKHLKQGQIEIESFAADEEVYKDVIACARILRGAADELESFVKIHNCEVIDIARKKATDRI